MTLYDALTRTAGAQAPALKKHLAESGINDWPDLTKSRLYDFRDGLLATVAASSARTYLAVFKGVLARYEEEEDFCREFREILRARGEKPVKTYLSPGELRRLEGVRTDGGTERQVLYQFLIGAYTGMRISDIRAVEGENVEGDALGYVSQKTGIHAVVPCGERVKGYIKWVLDNEAPISLPGYNNAIRRLCKRAGITERVKVHKAGRDLTGEKWEFVSSHTARISFCTNLAALGVPLLDISRMAGHSSTGMTERYIVNTKIDLPAAAQKYFE